MPVLLDTNAKMVAVSTTVGKVCVHHGRNEATTTTVVLVSTTVGKKAVSIGRAGHCVQHDREELLEGPGISLQVFSSGAKLALGGISVHG